MINLKKTTTAIMDYSADYTNDHWVDICTESDFDTFAREYLQKKDKKLACLVNVDYSLNSPLISDEIEEFIKFLRSQSHRSSWSPNKWTNFKNGLKHYGIHCNNIKSPSNFHSWWGRFNLGKPRDLEVVKTQLSKAQAGSNTYNLPRLKSFYQRLAWEIHNKS